MGQTCPRSAPPHHYTPTHCQGVSTAVKISTDKSKLHSSQSSMESKVISRGASCTQDDIRRSFRKEKEKEKENTTFPPQPSCKAENAKCRDKDIHLHENVLQEEFPKTLRHHKQENRHRPPGQLSMQSRKSLHKEEATQEVRGHRHRHRRAKGNQQEISEVAKDNPEKGGGTGDCLKADRYFMSHQTHEIVQKGSLLEIHVHETDAVGQQGDNHDHGRQHHRHHHHRSHHHQHRRSGSDQKCLDRLTDAKRSPGGTRTPTSVTQLECSTQNEHNTKISVRRTLPPNSQQASSSSSARRSHRDRVGPGDAPSSARSSGREKKTTKDDRGRQRSRGATGPVYSLPPLLQ